MYQNELDELPRLSEEKIENIFNVYLDENNQYFYNLLQNISIPDNLPDGLFNSYIVTPGDTLPVISYKNFGTIHLWWVVCLANKINDPTKIIEPGTALKILNKNTVRVLIQEINR